MLRTRRIPRLRRSIRRHFYWILVTVVLLTLLVIQSWPARRVPLPDEFPAKPPYAQQSVIIPAGKMTTAEFVECLRRQVHARIDVVWPIATAEMPVTMEAPITCTLAEAVKMLCGQTDGTLAPAYDPDRLLLGSDDDLNAPSRAVVAIYPVADFLIVSDPRLGAVSPEERLQDIEQIIEAVVRPDSWRDNGGTAGIIKAIDGKLIITATPDMHYQIRQLLDALRH